MGTILGQIAITQSIFQDRKLILYQKFKKNSCKTILKFWKWAGKTRQRTISQQDKIRQDKMGHYKSEKETRQSTVSQQDKIRQIIWNNMKI